MGKINGMQQKDCVDVKWAFEYSMKNLGDSQVILAVSQTLLNNQNQIKEKTMKHFIFSSF